MLNLDDIKLRAIGDAIDQLVTVDFHGRGIMQPLHQAIRAKLGASPTYLAAKGMAEALSAGHAAVLIGTGFLIDPVYKPETDGVIGGSLLARALSLGFDATPFVVAEDRAIPAIKGALLAAGLHPYDDICLALEIPGAAGVVPFPVDPNEAETLTNRILETLRPKVMVSIERAGRNLAGVYHRSSGRPIGDWVAPVDDLFSSVRERGGFTVGIGDYGNELGFGSVRAEISPLIPFGSVCRCPCQQGVASAVEADVPIIADTSEAGTYGLIACLSAATGKNLLHDERLEQFVAEQAVLHGAVEGETGRPEWAVDLIDVKYLSHLINLLHAILIYTQATWDLMPRFLDFMQASAPAPTP